MYVIPVVVALSRASASDSSNVFPASSGRAPELRIPSSFTASTHSGTNTVAGTPRRSATKATARPWFPLEQVTIPR